jgi:hypothetical protein
METKINDVLQTIDRTNAVSALDEMFQGWLASPRCGDELTSPAERQEIGYFYRKMRELFTICN